MNLYRNNHSNIGLSYPNNLSKRYIKCITSLKILFIYCLFTFFSPKSLPAQIITLSDSSQKQRKPNFLIVPVVFKSIETKWAIGLSGSMAFKTTSKRDSLTRTSTIQSIALFTQRRQNIQVIDASIFFPKEKYILYLQTSHSYFPDKFWGLGSKTKDHRHENYSYSQIYLMAQLKRKIIPNLFTGLIYEYQNVYDLKYIKNDVLDTSLKYGKSNHVVSGLGGSISYDNRNSSFWPTNGVLLQISYRGAIKSVLGSSFTNLKTIVDLRGFKELRNSAILAVQYYSILNFKKTPIRELAMMGGAYNLRGFYQGRYRDQNMSTFIGELRIPVSQKFSACFFTGFGWVYSKVKDLAISNMKSSFGAGIRYAILPDEKLNVRIDYGFSDMRNKGLYFTVGECF